MRSFIAMLLLLSAAAAQDQPLPNGAGKEKLQQLCTNCHDLEAVIGSRRTRGEWNRLVNDMMSRGAQGTQGDMDTIVSYLTANFGKINVNTASAADIEKTLELTSKEAQAIVDFREKHGKFADFDQLKTVPGVSVEKLDAKRPLIAFSM